MKKTKAAGFIIYRKEKEVIKYLLLQFRSGIYWKHPSGRIDKGESDEQAALRELEEETSLTKNDIVIDSNFKEEIRFDFKEKIDSGEIEEVDKITIFFLAQSKTDKIEISAEHLDWGWFEYEKALELGYFKEQKALLKEVHHYLSN